MKDFLIIVVSAIILIILDFIFISFIMNGYKQMVSNVQNSEMNINYFGAIFCYILLIFSLYYFILKDKKSVLDAFLLGIVIYGILESTNYSIFKKWDAKIAIMDTLWGGILFASTTYFVYYLANIFKF
jgi:uncharacterized membrane protein